MRIAPLLPLIVLAAAGPLLAGKEKPLPAPGTIDPAKLGPKDDRLEEAWFGKGPFAWHGEADDHFDYLWVKPGFSFAGRKVEIAGEPVKMLGGAKREENEVRLAGKISDALPAAWQKCFKKYWKGATVVPAGQGDLIATYRVVDAMEPAGFGMFSFGQVAYDLKIVDRASGETLLALHNASGTGRKAVEDAVEDVTGFCEAAADPLKAWTDNPRTKEEVEYLAKLAEEDD